MVYDGSRVLVEEKVFRTALSELFPDSVGNRLESDPSVVAFIEVWKDRAAFEFHIRTEHFTGILPGLKDFVEESYPAEFYTEVAF